LQKWGWFENVTNVEPWRQFSWRTGPATAGEPRGHMILVGFLKQGEKTIPAGARIYLDGIECYLVP
jgi:hypothetical protein